MPPHIEQAVCLLRAVSQTASRDPELIRLAARVSLLTHEIEKTYGGC
jgi:hypothetical protein